MRKFFILLPILLLLVSCQSAKQVPYLQNVDEIPADVLAKATYVPEQILMPGDLLDITVMATDRVSVQPFNRRVVDLSKSSGSLTSDELNFYLVDNSGYIDMPVLGRIYVQGMTKSELENYIREEIYPKYIHEVPAVTVRFEPESRFITVLLPVLGTPSTIKRKVRSYPFASARSRFSRTTSSHAETSCLRQPLAVALSGTAAAPEALISFACSSALSARSALFRTYKTGLPANTFLSFSLKDEAGQRASSTIIAPSHSAAFSFIIRIALVI